MCADVLGSADSSPGEPAPVLVPSSLGAWTARAIAGLEVRTILAVAAIFGAWVLLPTAFTLHYARLYYTATNPEPILDFRGGPRTTPTLPTFHLAWA
jgi:hypothetical protein